MRHQRLRPLVDLLVTLGLCAAGLTTAEAQQVRTAITPDSIRVGDVFNAAIRVEVPPGFTLTAPDSLPIAGEVENAGRVRRTTRELPDGGEEVTIVYPLTAWRTGEHTLPAIRIRVAGPDSARDLAADLPSALVSSVLPADTAGIDPRPPKDVVGPSRLLWPWIVGVLTVVAALTALVYYRRRLRDRIPALTFDVAHADSPKERALASLDEIRASGLLEAGEFKRFYSAATAALRAFLEEFDTAWGTELTSSEIVMACRDAIPQEQADQLAQLLHTADQVKFNRREPATAEALAEWRAVRDWVDHFELLGPVAPVEEP
jgi:hypothetical protein